MPMGIELCMILPRGPCTWPNTRKHRIAGRHKRRAGRIRRSLKRQFCAITALTGGNRHITTPMGQVKRLVTGQRKEAAMGRSRGIIGLQRISFAHVLCLKIINKQSKKDPEHPDRSACEIKITEKFIAYHGRLL